MRRPFLQYGLPTLLLLVVVVLPLVTGAQTLYFRDVLNSHYPIKASHDRLLADGDLLPSIDPQRGSGQPLLGNPNAVPLYPDNVLYLLAHPLWALNAHFWVHWLVALFAGFSLGRAWRLRRPGSWACGVAWATGGYFLSQLNLYNMVATVALAPALVAAFLLWERRRDGRSVALATLLWGLVILAGDPTTAAFALVLSLAAAALRSGSPRIARSPGWLLAVVGGVLLAAPMVVEMLRILPLSFRGHWQYRPETMLAQSWHPVHLLDWLVPGFFGRVDLSFWGRSFFGGEPPFFLSLFPGWIAVGLALVGAAERSRRTAWAATAILFGLFLSLGAHNPLLRLASELPGASLLRYPVKAWLGVALGLALLAGLGMDRLVAGAGRRRLAALFGGVAGLALLASSWIRFSDAARGRLAELAPQRLVGSFLDAEVERWLHALDLSILVLVAALLLLFLARRRPAALAALLFLHAAAQLVLLAGLYATDDASIYRAAAPPLVHLPEGALVAHGGFDDRFGAAPLDPRSLPDFRHLWQTRMDHAELLPLAGVPRGVRYAFTRSPEGLDSFYTTTFGQLLPQLDDLGRLRLLEAAGVDVLLLARDLAPEAAERTTLLAQTPSLGRTLRIYRLERTTPEAFWVGEIRHAEHLNAAVGRLLDPAFDPQRSVVVPTPPDPGGRAAATRAGAAGEVEILESGPERLRLRVRSDADGMVVVQRSFLSIWRANVDGAPAEIRVANGHRMGIPVGEGAHEVVLWVARRTVRGAVVASLLALLGVGIGLLGPLLADLRSTP